MIKFTIPIDPVPYLRMTQAEAALMRIPRSRIRAAALQRWQTVYRYLEYKKHVWALSRMELWRSSLDLGEKIRMDCIFYFRSGKHGDPDNCWKAIADSLFTNDSKVIGSFDFFFHSEVPRTEVVIEQVIEEQVQGAGFKVQGKK
jgi:Holliday junction resolvase RusA-like endonuclease